MHRDGKVMVERLKYGFGTGPRFRYGSVLTYTVGKDGKVPWLSGSSMVPTFRFGSLEPNCSVLVFGRHYEFCLNHAIRFNFFEIWNFLDVKCSPIPSCKNLKRKLWLKKIFYYIYYPVRAALQNRTTQNWLFRAVLLGTDGIGFANQENHPHP